MLVVNNIVKMEWDASQWLEINVKGSDGKKRKHFVMACKEYLSINGNMIPVFFNSDTAWVHEDEEGTFSFAELKKFVQDEADSTFPEMFEEYHPLVVADEGVNEANIQKYGLSKVKEELINRLKDLAPYSQVSDD